MQPVNDPLVDLPDVVEFMQKAHGAQTRKHGAPYWEHPVAVCRILIDELGVTDRDAATAALLHDVVEDTEVDKDEIARRYGTAIAGIVIALTKPPLKEGQDKVAANAAYYPTLAGKPQIIRQIKIADRLHNLREMVHGTQEFRARYLKDTVELMKALEGTPGIELLHKEYAQADARFGVQQS